MFLLGYELLSFCFVICRGSSNWDSNLQPWMELQYFLWTNKRVSRLNEHTYTVLHTHNLTLTTISVHTYTDSLSHFICPLLKIPSASPNAVNYRILPSEGWSNMCRHICSESRDKKRCCFRFLWCAPRKKNLFDTHAFFLKDFTLDA